MKPARKEVLERVLVASHIDGCALVEKDITLIMRGDCFGFATTKQPEARASEDERCSKCKKNLWVYAKGRAYCPNCDVNYELSQL